MINYCFDKNIDIKKLQELFLSVSWESGWYPEGLHKAIKNSDTVLTAWNDTRLIGLISAISDKTMNTFIPYLLICPEYQHQHIGETMLKKILAEYKDCCKKILICSEGNLAFYNKYGFEIMQEQFPVIISEFDVDFNI